MSRIRVISPSQALYVGPSPSTGAHASGSVQQLYRVQSVNYDFSLNREDVTQFGSLAAIDRVQVQAPEVSLDFSYLVTDVVNEERLGFTVDGSVSCISGLLSKAEDDKNYFILTTPQGSDANGNSSGPANGSVIGIGNGFISSYSTEGAVGGFPTASVNVEALHIQGYASGVAQPIPAVNPVNGQSISAVNFTLPAAVSGSVGQATALQAGDITLSLGNSALFVDTTDLCIQSYSLSFDLSREAIECLGSKYAKAREIQFPINVSLQVEALAGDLVTGKLNALTCNDVGYDMSVTLRKPSCAGNGDIAVRYTIKNAKLDGQSWSASIGPAQTVTMNWVAQLGGPEDLNNGLFISGLASADY
jgi:hypothetical protein